MKKILFVINNFRIGGIQKSLAELLKLIVDEYDITIYCPNYEGPILKELPPSIKMIEGNRWAKLADCCIRDSIRLGLAFFMMKCVLTYWSRVFGKKYPARLYVKLLNLPSDYYDIAVSYSHSLQPNLFANLTNEIVLYGIKSRHKLTFLHCDYGEYEGRSSYSDMLYGKFDGVVAVSNSVGRKFLEILPSMSSKLFVVQNACDIEGIREASCECQIIYRKPCMVSVSRLSEEKGLIRCLDVVKRLIENGMDFEWHIVGGGYLKKTIEDYIERNCLAKTIILEGPKSNPYPYMKNADYLFLPSIHEAAPMVFNEAACLGTPILTTKTLSAVELVEKRQLGIVCENNPEAIEQMLIDAFGSMRNNEYKQLPENYNQIVKTQFSMLCQSF